MQLPSIGLSLRKVSACTEITGKRNRSYEYIHTVHIQIYTYTQARNAVGECTQST